MIDDKIKIQAFDAILSFACWNQIHLESLSPQDYTTLNLVAHSCMHRAYNLGLERKFETEEPQ